ncbi:NAD(P)-dependent oxidoreductase [Rhizobium calliandrae]|uniref:NAD(P)-dependent oxidoreductase n=1 Tax=Rhizobium calliandrae TaxID=1312182 RepID=A0ABT7KL80_9HYPH|nr:NAD(P)-dependent oxidoreductase [Rhizobium calliandrae]MDL2409394.1 NAD(P)-dependent oxidoreductase [Rhizobium calliandrae]
MIFVIGGTGRLARAIAARHSDGETITPRREVYQDWWMPNAADAIREYFEPWERGNSTIFVVSGLLDPHAGEEDILKVNYYLPKNIVQAAAVLGIRVVTFGTIMERLLSRGNPYVQSKIALGRYVSEIADNCQSVAHVRLHTLYGLGQPSSFMFLGQILHSLRTHSPFEMTLGKQLREYHHFDDDADAIYRLVEHWRAGVVDLNHGCPITLREIATTLFSTFGEKNLLKIGARPEPAEENYDTSFRRPDFLADSKFRDALPAIVKYIESCLVCCPPEV